MQLKNIFCLGVKNFIRDKWNIVSILLISISLSLIILCSSFKCSLNNYWNDTLKNLIDYRTFLVYYNSNEYNESEAISQLKNINHVIESFGASSYLVSLEFADNDLVTDASGILLVGTISEPVKLIDGSYLNSVSIDENPVICSNHLYPFAEVSQSDYLTSKTIDMSKMLNKKLNLSFIGSQQVESFTVVGLYDSVENHAIGDVCYTPHEVVKKINNKYQPEPFVNQYYVYVVIDDVDNEELVSSLLKEKGFVISTPTMLLNKTLGNNIISILTIILIISIIVSVIFIGFMFVRKFNNRKEDYVIMKKAGYLEKEICYIYIFEFCLDLCISFLMSFILYKLILFGFQSMYLYNKVFLSGLIIKMNISSIYIMVVMMFVLGILYFLLLKKYVRKNSVKGILK